MDVSSVNWIEVLGNAAAVLVALSLTRKSLVQLRWLNLVGASLFTWYGFLIGAWPVGFLNGFIVCVNVYYLWRAYRQTEDFRTLAIVQNSEYLRDFLHFHGAEIAEIFPDFRPDEVGSMSGFYVMHGSEPVGVFLGRGTSDGAFEVEIDFAIPSYRDYQIGHYILRAEKDFLLKLGARRLVVRSANPHHVSYCRKLGFVEKGRDGERTLLERAL